MMKPVFEAEREYIATMSKRNSDWIQTFTGKRFWPLDPQVEDVDIMDIAHSLALQCRFTGHVVVPYSGAEHSVRVMWECPEGDRLWGLLHDASEAYLMDLPRPLKGVPGLGDVYKLAEARCMAVICEKFGLPIKIPKAVKEADTRMLFTEKRDLMVETQYVWMGHVEPYSEKIRPWGWREAETLYLMAFNGLTILSKS